MLKPVRYRYTIHCIVPSLATLSRILSLPHRCGAGPKNTIRSSMIPMTSTIHNVAFAPADSRPGKACGGSDAGAESLRVIRP